MSSSREGTSGVPGPFAAWLEMSTNRDPVSLAASMTARVPSTLTARSTSSLPDRVSAAACTRTSVPAIAAASAAAWSADSRDSTPSGSGFVLPGRTIARTVQPAR